ncbi:unnamed protein product [Ilex paraguariensis]|uniref:Uncharacterized protein n=1 Tax=Ilex paraguariensis TaxID=185542 RepID=A0ABC8RT76_9AQUA
MQDQRMQLPDEASVPKPRKKKPSTQTASKFQTQGDKVKRVQEIQQPPTIQKRQKKATKRGLMNQVPQFQQPEKSTSDSLPDSSTTGNEYRALRRRYLLLEEESCVVGGEMTEVEAEIRTLEGEKLSLLDKLVVLEGLVDPSEFEPQRPQLT